MRVWGKEQGANQLEFKRVMIIIGNLRLKYPGLE